MTQEGSLTMPRRIRHRAVGPLAAAAVMLACAAPASAATLRGTVVHHNSRAHGFVLATRSGRLAAIHAQRSARVGRVVRVSARRLRNGTYAARRVSVLGSRRRVVLRGTVTYLNRRSGAFTLSTRGASILIRRPARGAQVADASPSVGTRVLVEADVDDQGELEATEIEDQGEDTNGIELEGTILAIDTTARTLTVSADDDEQSGATIAVSVPSGIDLSAFSVGEEVELVVTRAADGTFVLQQAAGDDNEQEADEDNEGDEDSGEPGSGD
jgi:hypothetical protein